MPGTAGKITHAQLTFRNSMIMLGSGDETGDYDRLVKHPLDAGGVT